MKSPLKVKFIEILKIIFETQSNAKFAGFQDFRDETPDPDM